MLAVVFKDSGMIDQVVETIKKIGGDLIKDIRITLKSKIKINNKLNRNLIPHFAQ